MARFYGSMSGGRGNVTRTGGKDAGIRAHVRGWNVGVRVVGHVTVSGDDEFHIYATGGSNGGRNERMIGVVTADGRFSMEPGAEERAR